MTNVQSDFSERYPDYSRSERIADATLHILGVTAAITGAILLITLTKGGLETHQSVAILIYCATLVGTFVASAFYHFTPWESWRPLLRRIDHAAIYLKIAGTYTPLVILIGSTMSYFVLSLIWILAAAGTIQKLFFWHRPGRYSTALYLMMGWLGATLFWPILPVLPPSGIGLMVTGGLLYTAGVLFFNWESLRFSLAIWHGFVLVASVCLYSAIAIGIFNTLI